jgi:hypothetical protein
MKKYKVADVSESQLEELIRHYADKIEEGMKYVTHQRKTNKGRLDVLMVDSGGALVVAELKVAEDDDMLVQGLDYYDYITAHIETFSRAYDRFGIKPDQRPRLALVAPGFSVSLLNRCKWIDIQVSLFTYKCITFEGESDIVPIFTEVSVPEIPQAIEEPKSVGKILEYIIDLTARAKASEILKEIGDWDKPGILIEPIKYEVSLKISGKVFAYCSPRRQFFGFYTYDADDDWKWFPVKTERDLAEVMPILKANLVRLKSK